ncbi:hypothetical protein BGW80DRAFT_909724 [Lactifluus volemus]|nr:hypothetical protein BGW80DRAFT_909724 [Lactifluus volemus]
MWLVDFSPLLLLHPGSSSIHSSCTYTRVIRVRLWRFYTCNVCAGGLQACLAFPYDRNHHFREARHISSRHAYAVGVLRSRRGAYQNDCTETDPDGQGHRQVSQSHGPATIPYTKPAQLHLRRSG